MLLSTFHTIYFLNALLHKKKKVYFLNNSINYEGTEKEVKTLHFN